MYLSQIDFHRILLLPSKGGEKAAEGLLVCIGDNPTAFLTPLQKRISRRFLPCFLPGEIAPSCCFCGSRACASVKRFLFVLTTSSAVTAASVSGREKEVLIGSFIWIVTHLQL